MYYVEIHVEILTFDPVGDGGIKSVCMTVKMYRVRSTKKDTEAGLLFFVSDVSTSSGIHSCHILGLVMRPEMYINLVTDRSSVDNAIDHC